jgi:hypothetical protein
MAAPKRTNRAATASDWATKKGGRGTSRTTKAKSRRIRYEGRTVDRNTGEILG